MTIEEARIVVVMIGIAGFVLLGFGLTVAYLEWRHFG